MKFYAAADPNQMPIKSIKVDWGDDSPIIAPKAGSYPNQRGLVDGKCNTATNFCTIKAKQAIYTPLTSKVFDYKVYDAPVGKKCPTGKDSDCKAIEQCISDIYWLFC